MALTGDFHRLEQLRRQLATIAAGVGAREFAQRLATEVHAQIIAGAREQRDPYGRRWAPRKSGGGWALLDKTGRMLNSVRARPIARGVAVTAADYAGYHQTGTRKMPARKLVPDSAQGLGPIWTGAIARVVGEVARQLMGGG